MTAGGSQQLRLYRRARRDGATVMTACANSGIALSEARLIEVEDAKSPPPPDAFELLYDPAAVAAPPAPDSAQPQEAGMGRPKNQAEPAVEQVHAPDFDLAVRLYRQDIRPALSKVGEFSQEMSQAYKALKKQAHIQPQAARSAFRLVDMEEAKRDDYLRSFNGLLKALGIFMPVDLVDAAEGKGAVGDSVVPIGERRRPQLATIPAGPAGDTDLVAAADNLQAAE